jgi:hypothetical protein
MTLVYKVLFLVALVPWAFCWTPSVADGLPQDPSIYGTNLTKRAYSLQRTNRNPGLWPGAIIRWKYDSAMTERLRGADVRNAISQWKLAAPCLQFQQQTTNQAMTKGVLIVTLDGSVCSSHIGYYAGFAMKMTLPVGRCGPAGPIHEFGHTLGLYHENQRPDREFNGVRFACQNHIEYPWKVSNAVADATCCVTGKHNPALNTRDNECGSVRPNFIRAENLAYPNINPLDFTTRYDKNSIMHYRRDAAAKPGTQTLPGANAGDNNALTQSDKTRIKNLYCNANGTPIPAEEEARDGEEDDGTPATEPPDPPAI